jgi:hypothetical protein
MKIKQYERELHRATSEFEAKDDVEISIIETILEPLIEDILKPNGKLNVWWIIWNISKLVARYVAAVQTKKAHES